MSVNAQAQEEGGTEEEREEGVIVSSDSSNREVILEENKPEPLNEFRVPAEELPDAKPINGVPQKATPVSDGPDKPKIKEKEGKSGVSFNILYYLIYKFKHVDVFE